MGWHDTNEAIFDRDEGEPPRSPESYRLNPSKRSKDDALNEAERYQRLLKLGATEHQAKEGSWDSTAYLAMRIYLRGE